MSKCRKWWFSFQTSWLFPPFSGSLAVLWDVLWIGRFQSFIVTNQGEICCNTCTCCWFFFTCANAWLWKGFSESCVAEHYSLSLLQYALHSVVFKAVFRNSSDASLLPGNSCPGTEMNECPWALSLFLHLHLYLDIFVLFNVFTTETWFATLPLTPV